jgi:nitrite reductase/ring-hydroxylating ferredoxin subunit
MGIGVPLLAACGDDSSGGDTATDPTSSAGASGGNGGVSGGSSGGGGASDGLASTSDIEVGGGTIFADEEVVITQPTDGDFKGFSSTCTHQGCQVSEVIDGSIHCPCHNSMFSIEDGSVVEGPATEPLPPVEITVQGGSINLA